MYLFLVNPKVGPDPSLSTITTQKSRRGKTPAVPWRHEMSMWKHVIIVWLYILQLQLELQYRFFTDFSSILSSRPRRRNNNKCALRKLIYWSIHCYCSSKGLLHIRQIICINCLCKSSNMVVFFYVKKIEKVSPCYHSYVHLLLIESRPKVDQMKTRTCN